jgi:hypothetical protein
LKHPDVLCVFKLQGYVQALLSSYGALAAQECCAFLWITSTNQPPLFVRSRFKNRLLSSPVQGRIRNDCSNDLHWVVPTLATARSRHSALIIAD